MFNYFKTQAKLFQDMRINIKSVLSWESFLLTNWMQSFFATEAPVFAPLRPAAVTIWNCKVLHLMLLFNQSPGGAQSIFWRVNVCMPFFPNPNHRHVHSGNWEHSNFETFLGKLLQSKILIHCLNHCLHCIPKRQHNQIWERLI